MQDQPTQSGGPSGDYGYDLVHEFRDASAEHGQEGVESPDVTQVVTESSDDGQDYSYDLAHDIHPQQP